MLEQLESTHRELHATGEKLRSTEAQRLVSARTAETLRLQLTEVSTENAALKAALKQRCVEQPIMLLALPHADLLAVHAMQWCA